LKLHLETARLEPVRWQESVTFSPSELGLDDVTELSPVDVEGTLTHAAPDLVLDARLAFRLTLPCDRCLAPVTVDVVGDLKLVVVQRRGGAGESEDRVLHEEELGILEVSGESLETRPLVAEQVLLNVPAKPLCREDCAGLCPSCGADRNLGPCGCEREEADPRWAALAEWKSKFDGAS